MVGCGMVGRSVRQRNGLSRRVTVIGTSVGASAVDRDDEPHLSASDETAPLSPAPVKARPDGSEDEPSR